MKAWIDGELVPQEEATVPILSHSFSRGSAIFEVMDVVAAAGGEAGNRGTPRPALFRIDAHVERFFRSAELLHMPLPLDREDLAQAVKETVRANALAAGAVKFYGYYAGPELGLIPAEPRARVAVFCFDLEGTFGTAGAAPADPVTVGISTVRKPGPGAAAVQAKVAGQYVNAFLARWEAVQNGYDDAIMIDPAGCVAEGPLSNVFFVKDGLVRTPTLKHALAGITRDSVIEIVRDSRVPFEEADIPAEEATSADEAFYTGSVVRIRPIRAVNGRSLGGVCPGPITSSIRKALDGAHEGRDPRYRRWLTYV